MMNLWTRYLLTVTLACFVVLTGCTKSRARLNPLDPSSGMTATPTPVPQQIWKNGVVGTFVGSALVVVAEASPASAAATVVTVTDDVTLDTSTLRLTALTSTNYVQLQINNSPFVGVNASRYSAGHIRFNIRLEKPAASFVSLNTMGSNLNLAGLSTSVFTHVDVPVSSCGGCGSSSDTFPFLLTASLTSSTTGALVTVNDIRWTAD